MENQIKTSFQNLLEKLTNWFDLAVTNLPNFIISIVVFFTAYWLSKNVQRWLDNPLKKIIHQASIRSLVIKISSTLFIFMGLVLALGILNLDKVLTSILAGAGVAGLAVGLALQGTLANSFSGIFLSLRDILNVGDFVETNGYSGVVQDINLRNTKIKEADNNIVIIPNRQVLENPFKNYGLTQRMRIIVKCGVGYESNLKLVKQMAIRAIKKRFPQANGENIEFHYLEFGGSAINFQMRFWVEATEKLTTLEAKSEAIMIIKDTFDKYNINIPYPIRTLQIDGLKSLVNVNHEEEEYLN